MTHETIEIHAGLGVAVLWLNRPEVRNAFNDTMIAELTAAFGELERDPAVRAVVLAGRSEEHTSELQSPMYLVCRLLLEKKKDDTQALSDCVQRSDHPTPAHLE